VEHQQHLGCETFEFYTDPEGWTLERENRRGAVTWTHLEGAVVVSVHEEGARSRPWNGASRLCHAKSVQRSRQPDYIRHGHASRALLAEDGGSEQATVTERRLLYNRRHPQPTELLSIPTHSFSVLNLIRPWHLIGPKAARPPSGLQTDVVPRSARTHLCDPTTHGIHLGGGWPTQPKDTLQFHADHVLVG